MSQLKVNAISDAAGANGNAFTLATDGTATGKITNNLSNRNMVYNGAMMVSQRGTSQTGVNSSGFKTAPDRWRFGASGSNVGTYTVSQAGDNPEAFTGGGKSFKVDCTTAHSSLAANELYYLEQNFEGYDCQPILAGTSNAKKLTLSFWVKAYQTGTWIVHLDNANSSRDCSASYTISASGTWEKKTITFPADTTGSFACSNAKNLSLQFGLLAGSDWNTGTLNTAWRAEANSGSFKGQTNLASSTDNYWQITGVQLEVSDYPTEFEHRSYGDELARCQRYYEQMSSYGQTSGYFAVGYNESGTQCNYCILWKVEKRTTPGVTTNGDANFKSHNTGSSVALSNLSIQAITPISCRGEATSSSSVLTDGGAAVLASYDSDDAIIKIDAEL